MIRLLVWLLPTFELLGNLDDLEAGTVAFWAGAYGDRS